MAKKKINIDKYASGLFLRTEEYADKVRQHYAAAVEELLKLSAKRHISPGETFSFADNKKLSESANIVLRGLYSAVYNEIKNGVAAEWQYANLSCDALIESIFGKGIMSDNHFAHWFSRNQDAMDAFFARKSAYGGMNLSQKVWKYTGELKTEMELALTLSMGEGEGASVISRKVRQYLQEPERLFRRIKTSTDVNGEPLYKLSKAAKAYHPGRGVYRSSYKNAMRLTRTETNMAYRTADYTRWQQLPFVVGVRVKLSKNHNCIGVPKGQFYDICDELAGDYPKDFKLVGWHPQCRCFTEPILAEEDEFVAIQKRVLAGEDVQSYNSVNEVKAMPKQMVKWMEKNKERMDAASTLPYWLQDNKKLIKKPTAAEIAKRRHEARTQEQIEDIKRRAEERRVAMSFSTNELEEISKELASSHIQYNHVEMLNTKLSEDEIIARVGGGDMTRGSCASVAFAWIANTFGMDVLDFRDGDSRTYFSTLGNLMKIAKKIGGYTSYSTRGLELMGKTQIGKLYYLTYGRHAAVTRRTAKGYEYLELQSPLDNGWKKLNGKIFEKRFHGRGACPGILIDVDLLKQDKSFRSMMGYINTKPSEQKKGSLGLTK
jgi:hypothetical protein